MRGQGIGGLLLADALHRILSASSKLGIFAVVVDKKDAMPADFYRAYGFRPFPLHERRLFLPTATAAQALARSI